MRFQGENCTLSFGLYFDGQQVLLNGTIWLRRPVADSLEQQSSRIRFSRKFSEADISNLQQWLASGSTTPFSLPDPLLYITRQASKEPDGGSRFAVVLRSEIAPPWWQWSTQPPLTIYVEVRPNEFVYLTNALSREHWSMNLTW